jgi:Bifunctional DNA primase/polymerase, N-terminal/Primase C terminal 1 (PriCT-1)
MPTFQDFAPAYAAAGIVPLPLGGDDGKKPLVKNPGRFGRRAAMELAANPRFAGAGLGFWCGAHNRLTVVDVDATTNAELQYALAIYGDSPVIVRTASGKHHAWYRYNGERRSIRPDKAHPIDILGEGGLCVAPPSLRPSVGKYEFLRGSLASVRDLPQIRSGAIQKLETALDDRAPIYDGGRGDALFKMAVAWAYRLDTKAQLLAILRDANETLCKPPLSDAEVQGRARSAWKYRTQGTLMAKGVSHVVLPREAIARWLGGGDLDQLALMALFHKAHAGIPGKAFAASPAAMAQAGVIGCWGKNRYRAGLRKLCDAGEIERVHKGGRGEGDPDLYRLTPPKGSKPDPNHNQTPLSPQKRLRDGR